jgi:hypothetical protein
MYDIDNIISRIDYRTFYENEFGCQIQSHMPSPFVSDIHGPDIHPSLQIHLDTGIWYDQREDQAGHLCKFVQLKYGHDFPEACKYLLQYAEGKDVIVGRKKYEKPKKIFLSAPLEQCKTVEIAYKYPEWDGFDRCYFGTIRSNLFEIDFYGTQGISDAYYSIYQHVQSVRDYSIQMGMSIAQQFGKPYRPRLAGYSGPVACPILIFDIDVDGDLMEAQKQTFDLFNKLRKVGFKDENMIIYFSGSKGFHIYAENNKLKELGGRNDLPEAIKEVAIRISGHIPKTKTDPGDPKIDASIYKITGLIRIPNSINSKSGLYKIPIHIKELQYWRPKEITFRAQWQRSIIDMITEHIEYKKMNLILKNRYFPVKNKVLMYQPPYRFTDRLY